MESCDPWTCKVLGWKSGREKVPLFWMQNQNIERDYFERPTRRSFFAILLSDQGKVRGILKQLSLSLKVWVTERSCAADGSLWLGPTSPRVRFLCGVAQVCRADPAGSSLPGSDWAGPPWRPDECVSMGLPPSPSPGPCPPSPLPQLFQKLGRMSQAYVALFQVLCVEWGSLLWWTDLFLWAVFFLCGLLCFLLVAVLQKQVCCPLRVTICHHSWKMVKCCSHINARLESKKPDVLTLLLLNRKSRCF